MERIKIFLLLPVILTLMLYSVSTNAQIQPCDDEFIYTLNDDSDNFFSIEIEKSSSENYLCKLFSIKSKTELINQINTADETQNDFIIFTELRKDDVYLIQVYGAGNDCIFTIGGMEGIKFEK